MEVAPIFGRVLEQFADEHPVAARRVLRIGWEAFDLKLHYLHDKRLGKGDNFLADMMMRHMIKPLKNPAQSAIVSIFTPCELMQEVGLNPYSVEAFSCYTAATYVGTNCIRAAEENGASETMCSYHRTFLGAAYRGLMPRPRCIVYTSLLCDANLVTFRELADYFDVPSFAIDVPSSQTPESIAYVADQLRDVRAFLERVTGVTVDESSLRERVARTRSQIEAYELYMRMRAERYVPSDVVSPFYRTMTNALLLGTEDVSHLMELMLEDALAAPPKKGLYLYWMHSIPYMSPAIARLKIHEDAQIVGTDLAQLHAVPTPSDDPFEEMAGRLVRSNLNGSSNRRIDAGIAHARDCGADGVVWFNHWGCKHTIGISQLAKQRFEEAGLPFLLLDGDGIDITRGGEGQMSTRLDAFIEMLGEGRA